MITLSGLPWGFRIHRHQRIFLTLGSAVALMMIGRFAAIEGPAALVFVVTGASFLTVGHLLTSIELAELAKKK